jgi:hypothetical protein
MDEFGFWACLLVLCPFIYSISKGRKISVELQPDQSLPHPLFSSLALFLSLTSGILFARVPAFNLEIVFPLYKRISVWYISCLAESPVITKSITTAFFSVGGDSFAQLFETRTRNGISDSTGKTNSSRKKQIFSYNKRRGLAFFLDGILLAGPLLHYAFDMMEKYFPTDESSYFFSSIIHIFINDYFIDTIYIALSFMLTTTVEGHSKELGDILKNDFVPTVKASWCTSFGLLPFEFACFNYCSLGFRVLVMNLIDILWQGVVSFFAHRSRKEFEETGKPIAKEASISLIG